MTSSLLWLGFFMLSAGGVATITCLSLVKDRSHDRWNVRLMTAGLMVPVGIGVGGCANFVALQIGVLPRLSQGTFELIVLTAVLAGCIAVRSIAGHHGAMIRRPARGFGVTRRWRKPAALHVALAAVVASAGYIALRADVVAHARLPEGQYDAWAIWNLRARFMAAAGDHWRLAFDPAMAWSHTDYPILLPLTVWRGWRWIGETSTTWPAVVAFAFGASVVLLLVALTSRLAGCTRGLLVGGYLLTLPLFADMTTWQYADLPVACFMLGAAGVAAIAWSQRQPSAILYGLAAMLAGFGAFTKNEGLVFTGGLSLTVGVGLVWGRQWRPLAAWAIGLSPGLLCVVVQKLTLAGGNDLISGSRRAPLLTLLTDMNRHAIVWRRIADMVPDAVQPWLLVTLTLALVLAPGRIGLRRPSVLLIVGGPLLLMLVAYDAAFLIAPQDLRLYVNTSTERVLMQWLPMALMWLAMAARWVGAKGYGVGQGRGRDALHTRSSSLR